MILIGFAIVALAVVLVYMLSAISHNLVVMIEHLDELSRQLLILERAARKHSGASQDSSRTVDL